MRRILVAAVSVLLWTLAAMAQNAADFKQPYPLGNQLPANSNFTGEVWLAPISKNDSLNLPAANVTFAVNFSDPQLVKFLIETYG